VRCGISGRCGNTLVDQYLVDQYREASAVITRRHLLQGLAAATGASVAVGGTALAEPWQTLATHYRITPKGWPPGLRLRLALIADLHICEPWLGRNRLEAIVAMTNALRPDAVLLLGDYMPGHRILRLAQSVPDREWARALSHFVAPLGIHAVQGNHDWWAEPELQGTRRGPTRVQRALENASIPVYENRAVRLSKDGQPFWIAGLGDQWAFWRPSGFEPAPRRPIRHEGVHDLAGTLAQVTDDAPVILMAHEPDIFPLVPSRVALTVSGHTHGGQVRVLGYSPIVPSIYGRRYIYGHIVEQERHLIVSGGLGCSALPIRLGVPPEIVIVELGDWSDVVQS